MQTDYRCLYSLYASPPIPSLKIPLSSAKEELYLLFVSYLVCLTLIKFEFSTGSSHFISQKLFLSIL